MLKWILFIFFFYDSIGWIKKKILNKLCTCWPLDSTKPKNENQLVRHHGNQLSTDTIEDRHNSMILKQQKAAFV